MGAGVMFCAVGADVDAVGVDCSGCFELVSGAAAVAVDFFAALDVGLDFSADGVGAVVGVVMEACCYCCVSPQVICFQQLVVQQRVELHREYKTVHRRERDVKTEGRPK